MANTTKNIYKTGLFLLIGMATIFSSCKKDNLEAPENPTMKFVYKNVNTYYLWNDKISSSFNFNDYSTPEELFEAMIYPTLDQWSFLTDNYPEVLDLFNGIQKVHGYRMRIARYETGNNVYGIIEYIYAGSPAANAGLKRGDIVIKANDQMLTESNYHSLLSAETIKLGLGEIAVIGVGDPSDLGVEKNVTAIEMSINPVLQRSVIDANGTKVGYLLYDQFIENYLSNLKDSITYLRDQGITELVLDLRYNPGGYVSTCTALASMLVPSEHSDSIFLANQWNANMTATLGYMAGQESEYFVQKFVASTVHLDLSQIFILTSDGSASASEAIINGLAPYMDVITIGGTTAGKNVGANLFLDFNSTYGMYLMIYKIANAAGNSDYADGLSPTYPLADDYTTPLGDETEPLLAKALELINGTVVKKPTKKYHFNTFSKIYTNRFEKEGMMINGIKDLKTE